MLFSENYLKMTLAVMWIVPFIASTLSLIFIPSSIYTINLSTVGVVRNADALKHPKEFITEIFEEPRFPKLLCAILASSIQNLQIMVTFGFLLCFVNDERKYVIAYQILYLFSGAIAGYFGVKLWKSMKDYNDMSKGWLNVSMPIPFFSIGTLYYFTNTGADGSVIFSWYNALVATVWLFISMLVTQLGGYLGMRNSQPIFIPIVISKTTRIQSYWTWFFFLVLVFLASVACDSETTVVLGEIWCTASKIYRALIIAITILCGASVICSFVAILNLQLCFGKLWCCWWKAFFTLGVPFGLYGCLRFFNLFPGESLIGGYIIGVTSGSIGVLLVFLYYYLQFGDPVPHQV